MKHVARWVLIGLAAILLAGCPNYGTHMGGDGYGGHMRGSYQNDYHMDRR